MPVKTVLCFCHDAVDDVKEWEETLRQRLFQLGATASLVALMSSVPALGQDDQVDPQEDEFEIDEIVVTGIRGSIQNSLRRKQNSTNVVDSIEAEDLGRFADSNLAQSLQRIPGVAIERSVSGDSRTITVRGLSAQFTRVEINGLGGATGGGGRSSRVDTSIRSSGQDGRNFNFGLLPSELFTSAIVVKSPKASGTEGGIAANVELNTPAPFDFDEDRRVLTAQGAYGEFTGLNPRVTGIVSHKFNDKFGILLGGVYARIQSETALNGFDLLEPFGSNVADATGVPQNQLDALVPRAYEIFKFERDLENISGIATVQFRPSESVDIRFDAIYAQSTGDELKSDTYIDLTRGVSAPTSLTIENGIGVSGSFDGFRRVQGNFRADGVDDTLQQYTLRADIDLDDNWTITPFVGYNERVIERPFNEINYFAPSGTFSYTLDDTLTNISTSATDFSSNASDFVLGNILRAQNDSGSDQFTARLDLDGEFDDDVLKKIQVGVRYNDRNAEVSEPFRGALNFNPTGPTLADLSGSVTTDFEGTGNSPDTVFGIDVLGVLPSLLGGQDLLDPNFDIGNTVASGIVIGSNDSDLLASSTVGEETFSAYVEGDLELGNLALNVGVRFVHTDQTSSGFQNVDGVVSPITVESSYSEFLPALNARYEVRENLFFRGAYSRALSRPSLQALSPRETFNFNTLTGSRGNPELEPFTVNQFDLGAEWYFSSEGLLAFTYFYKNFSSLIGDETVTLQREQDSTAGGLGVVDVEFNQPFNTGSGNIKGFEISAQTGLGFVGEALENAGVIFNFTRLSSEANIETISGSQLQPFPNLSPSSFNASLYYDDGIFDARLNYAWREGFLQDGLDPNGNFLFQEDFAQLDLTMSYGFSDNVTIVAQANNILGENLDFASSAQQVTIRRINLERQFILGLKVDF